ADLWREFGRGSSLLLRIAMHAGRTSAGRRKSTQRVFRAARDRMVADRPAPKSCARRTGQSGCRRIEERKRGYFCGRHRPGHPGAAQDQSKSTPTRTRLALKEMVMTPPDLLAFANAVASGTIR